MSSIAETHGSAIAGIFLFLDLTQEENGEGKQFNITLNSLFKLKLFTQREEFYFLLPSMLPLEEVEAGGKTYVRRTH